MSSEASQGKSRNLPPRHGGYKAVEPKQDSKRSKSSAVTQKPPGGRGGGSTKKGK